LSSLRCQLSAQFEFDRIEAILVFRTLPFVEHPLPEVGPTSSLHLADL